MKTDYYIGIDIGTRTGVAIWEVHSKTFHEISTMAIHKAIELVKWFSERYTIQVRVEDARQVRYNTDPVKKQGAGSIKRDATIWEDFLTDYKIPHMMVRPNKALTKWSAEEFNRQTGFKGKTSNHGRDAALLVWGL